MRGWLGELKIARAGPLSRITPSSRKQTRCGDVAREGHLVRGDQHRHAALGELAHEAQYLGDQLGVERARDLVEEQQLGPHRERAHDRDALLLTARQAVGIVVALVGRAEAREQLVRPRLGVGARQARAPSAARASRCRARACAGRG